jgi:hypothetical protein
MSTAFEGLELVGAVVSVIITFTFLRLAALLPSLRRRNYLHERRGRNAGANPRQPGHPTSVWLSGSPRINENHATRQKELSVKKS